MLKNIYKKKLKSETSKYNHKKAINLLNNKLSSLLICLCKNVGNHLANQFLYVNLELEMAKFKVN